MLIQDIGKWKEGSTKHRSLTTTPTPLLLSHSGACDKSGKTCSDQAARQSLAEGAGEQHGDSPGGHGTSCNGTQLKRNWFQSPRRASMTKMQEHIQELNEIAQNPSAVSRFKRLKRTNTNPGAHRTGSCK